MPKVLIKGDGTDKFDYLVSCNICKSVLLCDSSDIKKGVKIEICEIVYEIEMVHCDVCKKDIEFRENTIYVLPSGLIKIFPNTEETSNKPETIEVVRDNKRKRNTMIELPESIKRKPCVVDSIIASAKKLRID